VIRRLTSVLALLAAAVAALALTGADSGGPGKTYEVEFDSAFGLSQGGDLKIGGVKAGQTTGFELDRKPPYRPIVKVRVTEPGFDTLKSDARCSVRQQSLIGEYFVDCDVGKTGRELPSGGRIPVAQTSSTVPLDLIQNVMRRPYRERFRIIISELGTGLAGRPQDLNEVVRRAHPALRETGETIAVLRRQNRLITEFIERADKVSAAVEPVREDVARWAREASETAGIQASRSRELARYWNRLPVFLGELEPTMAQLEATADEQIPTLRKLGAAAPELESFLAAVPDFARNSRGSLRALGSASETGLGALRESREEVDELNELAKNAPRFGKPLRQFLQTIDDRRRSIDNDPEAGQRAPPAPDKTAFKSGQGYTGMENLLNYVYWQTMAINAYDDVGHVLRIVLLAASPCSRYQARPSKEIQEKCASWTGPFQPGVTGPDPTESRASRERLEALARENESRSGDDKIDGAPGGIRATEPKPGQRDMSQPQIVLPDAIRDLLGGQAPADTPADPRLPSTGSSSGTESDSLIDFLLGP
jgi:phospholipid/cholesterol/gamma-HCH transport system substrate-binding protein